MAKLLLIIFCIFFNCKFMKTRFWKGETHVVVAEHRCRGFRAGKDFSNWSAIRVCLLVSAGSENEGWSPLLPYICGWETGEVCTLSLALEVNRDLGPLFISTGDSTWHASLQLRAQACFWEPLILTFPHCLDTWTRPATAMSALMTDLERLENQTRCWKRCEVESRWCTAYVVTGSVKERYRIRKSL